MAASEDTAQHPGAPPTTLAVRIATIPVRLREVPCWVPWRWERTGKVSTPWAKVPVDVRTGRRASVTNPATWTTFGDALAYAEVHGLAGVGFVFSQNDPFAGVDLDGAIDPATGEPTPEADAIVAALG